MAVHGLDWVPCEGLSPSLPPLPSSPSRCLTLFSFFLPLVRLPTAWLSHRTLKVSFFFPSSFSHPSLRLSFGALSSTLLPCRAWHSWGDENHLPSGSRAIRSGLGWGWGLSPVQGTGTVGGGVFQPFLSLPPVKESGVSPGFREPDGAPHSRRLPL